MSVVDSLECGHAFACVSPAGVCMRCFAEAHELRRGALAAAERRVVLAAKAVRTHELAWAGALVGDDAAIAAKTASMLAADKELETAVDALLALERGSSTGEGR